jgi:ABC-type uncharacterized transport system ATPase subunit
VEALIGLREPSAGEILLAGEPLRSGDASSFAGRGGAVIPEDRHRDGVALELSLRDNLLMKEFALSRFSRRGVMDLRSTARHAERLISEFEIRTPGSDVRMAQLSGGNQQKAVVARELSREPRVVVAAQPTRGLDVGAMEFVYSKLAEAKRAGAAILLLSIELDEVLSLSDRIAVIVGGRFLSILDADEADAETVGLLMAGEVRR